MTALLEKEETPDCGPGLEEMRDGELQSSFVEVMQPVDFVNITNQNHSRAKKFLEEHNTNGEIFIEAVPCEGDGKQCRYPEWNKKTMAYDSDGIDRLIKECPQVTNWGMKLVGVSVLDCDSEEAYQHYIQNKEKHGLEDTFTVKSPRGYHIVFRDANKEINKTTSKLFKGLDTLGAGTGYAIMCHQTRPDGGKYLPFNDLQINPAPKTIKWIIDSLEALKQENTRKTEPVKRSNTAIQGYSAYLRKVIDEECAKIRSATKGERDNTLFASACVLASFMHGGELTRDDLYFYVRRAAGAMSEPLCVLEVDKKIVSAIKATESTQRHTPPLQCTIQKEPEILTEDVVLPTGDVLKLPANDEKSWATELCAIDFGCVDRWEPVPEIVEGLISTGENTLCFAPSNAGKTFFTLEMARCVAQGEPFFGRKVKQGIVIYVASENAQSIRRRVEAMRIGHGGSYDNLISIEKPMDFQGTRDGDNLVNYVREIEAKTGKKVRLVIIDNLMRVRGSANMNSDEMGKVSLNIEKVASEANTAIVTIHHSGKNSDAGQLGWSGNTALADNELQLARDENTKIITVKSKKMRDGVVGEMGINFTLRVVDLGVMNEWGKEQTSCVCEQCDAPIRAGVIKRSIVDSLKPTENTFYNLFEVAAEEHGVIEDGEFKGINKAGYMDVFKKSYVTNCGGKEESGERVFRRIIKASNPLNGLIVVNNELITKAIPSDSVEAIIHNDNMKKLVERINKYRTGQNGQTGQSGQLSEMSETPF